MDTVAWANNSPLLPGEFGRQERGEDSQLEEMVEREDSEMLMTQAAIDAMPLPRKSFMARRPSVVQFAELRQAAAAVAQESNTETPTPAPAPKPKTQVSSQQSRLIDVDRLRLCCHTQDLELSVTSSWSSLGFKHG